MKKLVLVFFAAIAMMACSGNSCNSDCACDSISVDSTDTIGAVDSVSVDTLVADSTNL